MAALNESFGMSGWVALVLHAVGVEVYVRLPFVPFLSAFRLGGFWLTIPMQLHLTPGEARRLRRVSYERQVRAGFRRPGKAGLVAGHGDVHEGGSVGGEEVEMGRKGRGVGEEA